LAPQSAKRAATLLMAMMLDRQSSEARKPSYKL
jgi:hypothetical protein